MTGVVPPGRDASRAVVWACGGCANASPCTAVNWRRGPGARAGTVFARDSPAFLNRAGGRDDMNEEDSGR